MPDGGTVYARNLQNGVTVMSSDPKSTQFVQWDASGDPSGGDIQPVSASLAESPAFLKAVRQGILLVMNPDGSTSVEGPGTSLDQILDKQRDAWNSRQDSAQADIRATIETTTNNDMVTLACVGPSSRGQQNCDEAVVVRELQKYDKPPLCSRHTGLASEFVSSVVDVDVKGTQIVAWTRTQMGERNQLPL